jgi:hypothetical protein
MNGLPAAPPVYDALRMHTSADAFVFEPVGATAESRTRSLLHIDRVSGNLFLRGAPTPAWFSSSHRRFRHRMIVIVIVAVLTPAFG